MAKVIKYVCDRCGFMMDADCSTAGFATHEIRKVIKYKRGNKEYMKGLDKPLDLCPKCYREFNKWLDEKKGDTE